ncbi:MAG: PEGA domain-containing protein, partial [Candidatus Poribacteria bacterium]|nr:PEGA domain-containing protein [Candidatus Poribacteria bacterium]
QVALDNIAREIGPTNRFIFYFRGFITRSRGSGSIHLLTHGATAEDLADALGVRQLNQWLRQFPQNPITVILDSYTRDRNLMAFYANREMLGHAAFVSIQRASLSAEDLFARSLLTMLQNDAADLDDNRQVSIDELYRHLTLNVSEERALKLTEGILLPMGEVGAIVLKLSPMLKVVSVPEGASIFLNEQEIGVTPKRLLDELEGGTYSVAVRKPGYLVPPTRSAQFDPVQGASITLSWDLESIEIYGRVNTPDGIALKGTAVWIDGTAYEQDPLHVGEDGQYRFPANISTIVFGEGRSDTEMLAPGKPYTLRAESSDLYHAEATFTLAPHESIQRALILIKKPWFEVAQMRFDRKAHEDAIAAFQNGIEETTDFPPMSPEFTQLLFDSFAKVVKKMNLQNIAYVVTTAKLADGLGLREEAKAYWTRVKSKAAKDSPEYKLATKRLRELNFGRWLINIVIFVVLIGVFVSGVYLFQKQRKTPRA